MQILSNILKQRNKESDERFGGHVATLKVLRLGLMALVLCFIGLSAAGNAIDYYAGQT